MVDEKRLLDAVTNIVLDVKTYRVTSNCSRCNSHGGPQRRIFATHRSIHRDGSRRHATVRPRCWNGWRTGCAAHVRALNLSDCGRKPITKIW